MTQKRTIPRIILACALGLLSGLALVELLLRLTLRHIYFYSIPDPHLVRMYKPGTRGFFINADTGRRVSVKINRLGFRGEDFDPADTRSKIIILGDSFLDALQTPADVRFPELVQKRLARRYLVIPLGMSRSGQGQELLYLEELALPLKPGFVFLLLYEGNDIFDNSPELSEVGRRSPWRLEGGKLARTPVPYGVREFTARHLILVRFFYSKAYARAGLGRVPPAFSALLGDIRWLDVYRKDYDSTWKRAWRITEGLLARMAQRSHTLTAPFFLLVLPPKYAFAPRKLLRGLIGDFEDYDFEKPARLLKVIGRKHNFPIIDLRDTFEAEGSPLQFYGEKDAHLSPAGHRVLANLIVSLVREHKKR